jgi:hypothetical protein
MPKITTLGDLRPDYDEPPPRDWATPWICMSPLLAMVVVAVLYLIRVFS